MRVRDEIVDPQEKSVGDPLLDPPRLRSDHLGERVEVWYGRESHPARPREEEIADEVVSELHLFFRIEPPSTLLGFGDGDLE